MHKISPELTYKKYLTLRYLWPFNRLTLPLSLLVFKVPGTVRIIEASTVVSLINNIRKSI